MANEKSPLIRLVPHLFSYLSPIHSMPTAQARASPKPEPRAAAAAPAKAAQPDLLDGHQDPLALAVSAPVLVVVAQPPGAEEQLCTLMTRCCTSEGTAWVVANTLTKVENRPKTIAAGGALGRVPVGVYLLPCAGGSCRRGGIYYVLDLGTANTDAVSQY